MNTELTNEVANRINDLHQSLLESVEQTKQSVNNAMMAAVEIIICCNFADAYKVISWQNPIIGWRVVTGGRN